MKSSADYNRLTTYAFDLQDDARRFEVFTLPHHDFAVANASTGMLLEIGIENIAAHVRALGDRLIQWADSRRDLRMLTPRDAAQRAGVLSFVPDDLRGTAAKLKAAGVVFVPREGAIRLAPHWYNTFDDMDRVIAALEQ
jgi:selenocysteine lyase/cysteine desulfurase